MEPTLTRKNVGFHFTVKWTESVTSSDPPCTDRNAGSTPVFLIR